VIQDAEQKVPADEAEGTPEDQPSKSVQQPALRKTRPMRRVDSKILQDFRHRVVVAICGWASLSWQIIAHRLGQIRGHTRNILKIISRLHHGMAVTKIRSFENDCSGSRSRCLSRKHSSHCRHPHMLERPSANLHHHETPAG
jgi:hypothetical protein